MVKCFKNLETWLVVGTWALAIFACLTWNEAVQLRELEEKPNILIEDVLLTLVDETKTPAKRRSWKEEELLNSNAVKVIPSESEFLISFKFSNTGKESASMELKEQTSQIYPNGTGDGQDGYLVERTPESYVRSVMVPGEGESGLVFGIKMGYEQVAESIVVIRQKFQVESLESDFHETLVLTTQCYLFSSDGGTQCRPIPN